MPGVCLVFVLALVSQAATGIQPDPFRAASPVVRADTDSVGVEVDSTLAEADTGRVDRYLRPFLRRDARSASLSARRSPLVPRLGSYWQHQISLDSTERVYRVEELVGGRPVRQSYEVDYDTYRRSRLDTDLTTTFRQLAEQRARQRAQQRGRGGLGVNINVPGGRQSAFTTIFGTPSVDLRVTGTANINAGFSIRKSDQQASVTGRQTQVDPEFRQDLRLGITGSIGDKMQVNVNWDTERDFDYQNELKLQYTGYDDDIIKNIEAGNVFLQTPSTLIRGGQSLFGIKSELQLGGVHLTTVVSQQEGQANSLSIDGGSETVEFDIEPLDYDERAHFFLAYYFRNRWEEALDEPPVIELADGFERITEIELWKLQSGTSREDLELRKAIAVVDLGEEPAILEEGGNYAGIELPDVANDQYGSYTEIVPGLVDDQNRNLTDKDIQTGDFFKKLELGRDYNFDPQLGYISLGSAISPDEALAVAFRYRAGGQAFQVGEFASDKPDNDERLVLKLLRPSNLTAPSGQSDPPAWYLEMRNIYPLRTASINNANDFELQIYYQPSGSPPAKTLPGVGGRSTLLQLLGLDRLNVDESPQPDDRFDYLPNFTIEPSRGLLIFPYLEPFGSRMEEVIVNSVSDPAAQSEAIDQFVFSNLYLQKKETAEQDTRHRVYEISGSYKGGVVDFYDLRAFSGVVEGSVRVTAGGTPLQEGVDYQVDYQGGTVSITNPAFLTAGRQIQIDYEQNSLFNIQKKTLLGVRAEYASFEDRLRFGSTLMRLSQKSPVDKFRLGEEPIANTIWGVDGNLDLEPAWLTRAIDFMPLVQTREPSQIRVSGEFAQLRPGHTQTTAFDQTRDELRDAGLDFKSDEVKGISYIDDFEGFETTFSLKQAGAWQLSAPPDSIRETAEPLPGLPGSTQDSLRSNWRGTLGWYSLNQTTIRLLGEKSRTQGLEEAVSPVFIRDVFPDRDTRGEVDQTLSTLDLYFDPTERGPYNYTRDLATFLNTPKDAWGGMTRRLPEGYNDFALKNIEFVEFIIRPVSEGRDDAGEDARLFLDLGSISEDILPNITLNNEDGLSISSVGRPPDAWGRTPSVPPDQVINLQNNRTEDLGLDGLASYDESAYDPQATESAIFADFLNSLDCTTANDPAHCALQVEKIRRDPSGDDYHYYDNDLYYLNSGFYPDRPTIQQRFSRYFAGLELNGFESQRELANNTDARNGNATLPDTEDLNQNSTVDASNNYFQYEIPLSKAALDELGRPENQDDFVVGEITDTEGNRTGWYQIRIPVQNPTRTVGSIEEFDLIESMRLWTTGHEVPTTIRFATFDLVGSLWRKAPDVDEERLDDTMLPDTADTRFTISSVNNEEDSGIYQVPPGAIVSRTRLATGQTQNAREQSLVLRAENLPPAAQRAVSKTYATSLDLLKYSNLRMFVHMHGVLSDGRDLMSLPPEEARDKARLFVRLGSDVSNNYYEYEQPLTPSDFINADSEDLWQVNQLFQGGVVDLNSVNILLGAFNQLKVTRDEYLDENGMPFPAQDSVFWNLEEGVLRGPNAGEFAPPGTRLGIRGQPSLGDVNTIVIGIRNPVPPEGELGDGLGDVTVWINELRVSGYDEENGWAALANVDMKLADLGRVKANVRRQTDGFGALDSSLGERDQNDVSNWSVAGDLNLDKFIPERLGWSIPVSMQIQSNTSTPRFAPSRGDVRLEEIISQIRTRTDIDEQEKAFRIREARAAAQSHSYTRSFSFSTAKSNSQWPILQYTLDGLAFNYSYTDTDARSPSNKLNDSWRWQSTLRYRFNARQPKTLRPFWFLENIPLVQLLGDLRFNYLPQSFNASGSATRSFSTQQQRPADELTALEERIAYPTREQHSFAHRRGADLQYNPFNFLNLTFGSNTSQSLNQLGVDTLFSVIDLERDTLYRGLRINQAVADSLTTGITPDDVDLTAFEVAELDVVSARTALSGLFTGSKDLRTDGHDQNFTATFQPKFSTQGLLNWITIQPVTYQAQYNWQNAGAGRDTGAGVRNQVTLRTGITLRPQELWRKIPFYRTLEEQQQRAEAEAQAERQRREQARAARREARRQAREEERRRQEEEEQRRQEIEEMRARGEAVPEDSLAVPPQDTLAVPPQDTLAAPPQDTLAVPPQDTLGAVPGVDPNAPVPEAGEAEEEGGGGFPIPLPNPVSILRQAVLAVTGIRDLSITYTGTRGASSSNVGVPQFNSAGVLQDVKVNYSLVDALFRGEGPPVGYRFGLERRIDLSERVFESGLQVQDVLTNNDRFQAQTSLNPTSQLSIRLNWSVDWDDNENISYQDLGLNEIQRTETRRGSNSATIWAFNADYLDFFERQFNTYVRDAERAQDPNNLSDNNGDGQVFLTNESLVKDFNDSYIRTMGPFGGRKLLPFPLPNWQVNYTGVANWPIFRMIAQSATIRHGYSSDYSLDYQSNLFAGTDQSTASFQLGGKTITYTVPDENVNALRVNERFQPLVGLDLGFKNRIQTSVAWNKSNAYSLSTTSFEVSESSTSEITFTASYQTTGMKLPFIRRRLDNRVNISLTLARAVIADQRYRLRQALEDAIATYEAGGFFDPAVALEPDNAPLISGSTRLTVAPQISYQFSNRVRGDFRLRFEQFDSEDPRIPSTVNTTGTFNINVSISN